MSSKIYGKLAITNLKNNRKTYVPYILMAVLSVMMYYIVGGMAQGNNGLSKNVKMIMGYMNGLLMIFSVIFLFYTNSFLIKRRKREIGIYNILGMGKGHIAKMLAIEAVITAFISIFGGILLGIVFGKLMYLVLGKLLHYDISVKVTVEIPVLEKTFVFFMAIFVLILLYNLLQIRIVSPVELLHGSNQGEREPKTKWLLASVGAILLGTGYYIAQTTGNPLDAMTKFFFAVVCVVLGTYGLFIAGSIAVLKMLKKNKKYYYQAKHFTAVSGMIYRMKQNAVGLANICILSTMVLIMVSTTVCLYAGMNDIINTRYPRECEVTISGTNDQAEEKVQEIIVEVTRKNHTKTTNERVYHSGELTGYLDGNKMILDPDKYYSDKTSSSVVLIPLADYNRLEEKNETLNDGEVLLFSTQTKSYGQNEIYLDDTKFNIKKELDKSQLDEKNNDKDIPITYMIMKDEEQILNILKQTYEKSTQNDETKASLMAMTYYEAFDMKGSSELKKNVEQQIRTALSEQVPETFCSCSGRQINKDSFYELYGSLFFMGMYLGFMFLMVTVLIIYYKQISEGYDDKDRYKIMQQVGMDKQEVKKSIRSQVLMIFFLPLIMAIIHVAAAFKVITKLLAMFSMTNITLFIECTIATIIVFAVIYCIVFMVTEREYYRIVK